MVVRDVLKNNDGNVSKTARILKISRPTVRRARDGTLQDKSRRPHTSPTKIKTKYENLIVSEGRATGFRYRILSKFIYRKYSISIPESTVKAVLKRNKVKKKKIRTKNGNLRRLYDYENFLPFAELQVDTKHILDQTALPKDVYEHIIKKNLPLYEWNAIDAATRTRFTAYSYSLNSTFGFIFIMLVIAWIKTHNINHRIHIQVDNGSEFYSGSKRKEKEWNDIFNMFNAYISSIPPGAKHLQALVENSHLKDDQYFLSIHPIRCDFSKQFIYKAQQWQDTWNTARPHFGIAMNGKTPKQKLDSISFNISSHIFNFPVVLIEQFFKISGPVFFWLQMFLNLYILRLAGKYVYITYLIF